MQQSQIALLPGSPPGGHELHRTQQRRPRPLVERIAGWSARHRKAAVSGWLVLIAVVFAVGHAMGTGSAPAYGAGQSGWQPTREVADLAARGVRVADRDFTQQLHSAAPLVLGGAGVITLATLVMVAVFSSVATLSLIGRKSSASAWPPEGNAS